MGSTWFIQFNDYRVYFRMSGCMIKKTVTSRITTHCKSFEETAQITILSELYHISRKSNFASCFLSVHGKMTYSNWTATKKKLSSVICNNKGADQPAHPRSLISNFVICFLKVISRLATRKTSIFLLACKAEETGLRLALSETQKTGFLVSRSRIFLLLARQL